jgi:hypothetical protein
VIFNFRQWFENHRISAYLWATFFHPTSYVLILAKNWLGYIFGDFFTNSSGHPVCQRDENYCNLFKRGQRALFPRFPAQVETLFWTTLKQNNLHKKIE